VVAGVFVQLRKFQVVERQIGIELFEITTGGSDVFDDIIIYLIDNMLVIVWNLFGNRIIAQWRG
jgi:hypothetical protein